MKLSNGVEVQRLEKKEEEEIQALFHGYSAGLVRAGPQRCLMPVAYEKYAQSYLDLKLRPSDVVIMTYPKCGTTWTQEMVWTLLHNPDLDNPHATRELFTRSPFLEFDSLTELLNAEHGHNPGLVAHLRTFDAGANPDDGMLLQMTRHAPSRRVIKTHLPFSLMPAAMLDTCKVVYVARNPLDQVTSYLHHHRLIRLHDFRGTDAQFVETFCRGNLMFGDYALHVAEALAHKAHPNLTLLTFEDMKKDHLGAVQHLNEFLGAGLTTQQCNNVKDASSFYKMQAAAEGDRKQTENGKQTEDSNVNAFCINGLYNADVYKKAGFFRKGEVGSYKSDMAGQLSKKLEDWTQENFTEKLGYNFNYQ